MKLVKYVSIALIICSCAASNNDKTTVFVSRSNDAEYQGPSNDLKLNTLNTRDNTIQTVPMKPEVEERNYQVSLINIDTVFKNQWLKLQLCAEVHGKSNYCIDMLRGFCVVDELIDTRGDIHRKPFCADPLTSRSR